MRQNTPAVSLCHLESLYEEIIKSLKNRSPEGCGSDWICFFYSLSIFFFSKWAYFSFKDADSKDQRMYGVSKSNTNGFSPLTPLYSVCQSCLSKQSKELKHCPVSSIYIQGKTGWMGSQTLMLNHEIIRVNFRD